ncbi:MAG TPA: hypothetical protein P5307_23735 [Pirellulaceae bacterium]|mgnify:CR=1 FL=1|nr:hypothetical protein [Planctomycetales bacterium]HRX82109.1 hypothetical protein [Pirellulaceae bacterium]
MTRKHNQNVATMIESVLCSDRSRLSPRNWKAMTWFLDFIDHADSADDVNAYCDALDEHKLTLMSPII